MSGRTRTEVLLDAASVIGRARVALSYALHGRERCTGDRELGCDAAWACGRAATMLPSAGELRALQRELERLAFPYIKETS